MAVSKSRTFAKFTMTVALVSALALSQVFTAGADDRPQFRAPFVCGEQFMASAGPGAPATVTLEQPADAHDGSSVLASASGVANVADGSVVVSHTGAAGEGWDTSYRNFDVSVDDGARVERGDVLGSFSGALEFGYGQYEAGVAQAIQLDGKAIPYWLSGANRWASDAPSQIANQSGATGPWLSPASENCPDADQALLPARMAPDVSEPPTSTTSTTETPDPGDPPDVSEPPGTVPDNTIANATTLDELVNATDFVPDHADVLRLYWAFFVRDPDIGGAKYWLGFFNDGVSLDVIAANFAGSVEFANRYGAAPSNAEYVDAIYSNILGREPDAEGYEYWLDLLDTGQLGRGGVVRWMAANPEFIRAHPYP